MAVTGSSQVAKSQFTGRRRTLAPMDSVDDPSGTPPSGTPPSAVPPSGAPAEPVEAQSSLDTPPAGQAPGPRAGQWAPPPGYASAPDPGYAQPPGHPSAAPGYGPPPGYAYPGWPPAAPEDGSGGRLGRLGRNAGLGWGVAGLLALAVIALAVALATQSSAPARASGPLGGGPTASVPGGAGAGRFGGGFGGASGVVGTVSSVSAKSFVVQDRTGTSVTVNEQSSTTYLSGRSSATSSVVVSGARVAVQGTRNGNTVSATRVIVLPAGGFGGFGSAAG